MYEADRAYDKPKLATIKSDDNAYPVVGQHTRSVL